MQFLLHLVIELFVFLLVVVIVLFFAVVGVFHTLKAAFLRAYRKGAEDGQNR